MGTISAFDYALIWGERALRAAARDGVAMLVP
jgi:hypothetical protein